MHSHFSVLCENPYIRLAMGYFSENMSVYMCSRNIYTVYRPRPIQSPTETSLLMTDMKSCTENTSMILWCCSFEPGEEKKNAKTKWVRKWRKHGEQPSSHFIKKKAQFVFCWPTWNRLFDMRLNRCRLFEMEGSTAVLPWTEGEWWRTHEAADCNLTLDERRMVMRRNMS